MATAEANAKKGPVQHCGVLLRRPAGPGACPDAAGARRAAWPACRDGRESEACRVRRRGRTRARPGRRAAGRDGGGAHSRPGGGGGRAARAGRGGQGRQADAAAAQFRRRSPRRTAQKLTELRQRKCRRLPAEEARISASRCGDACDAERRPALRAGGRGGSGRIRRRAAEAKPAAGRDGRAGDASIRGTVAQRPLLPKKSVRMPSCRCLPRRIRRCRRCCVRACWRMSKSSVERIPNALHVPAQAVFEKTASRRLRAAEERQVRAARGAAA